MCVSRGRTVRSLTSFGLTFRDRKYKVKKQMKTMKVIDFTALLHISTTSNATVPRATERVWFSHEGVGIKDHHKHTRSVARSPVHPDQVLTVLTERHHGRREVGWILCLLPVKDL